MAEPRVLKLQSPAYGDPIYYKWPLVVTKRLDEPTEIADTIRLVCEDFPELKYAVENVILKDYDPKDYDSMNQLCQRYNKAIRNILSLWKGRAPPPRMFQPPNKELLRHIINLCYSHGIKEPEKLNLYEPFSPGVYGETSFEMIAQILEEIQVTNEDIFLDLGSGVGQVVLQAAASNRFKECCGVEKADTPAEYAKAMEAEFRKWMDWFGKIYSDFTLEKGDFLEDKWRDMINDSGVVFVNNFAFGPVVDHHLKTRFQTMKEGSKVISSREFVPLNFKFNKRNLSELGAMIRVSEIKPKSQEASVSWTGNTVSYYLHVVDRTRLEKYFSILKKKKDGQDLDEDELSLCSESITSMDTSGTPFNIETLEENLDDLYLGTTTRHQWQLLTDTINQSKQEAKVMPIREAKTRGRIKLTQQQQNIISQRKSSGKMQLKNKILQKYSHQKLKKKPPFNSQESSGDSDHATSPKAPIPNTNKQNKRVKTNEAMETKKDIVEEKEEEDAKKDESAKVKSRKKKVIEHEKEEPPPAPQEKLDEEIVPPREEKIELEKEIDGFLAGMKVKYLEFIKRINTREYSERLKVMIECETAKKKLLTQEINETERMVQKLISDSLRNFSSRLVELDLAVKTPRDLLAKSTVLAEKHEELENKVVNMEIEVFNLEEKYKTLCAARNLKNQKYGLEPMIDSDNEDILQDSAKINRKKELETKLCGAILTALNHRRSLMDQQSSLAEQISILEKISHTEGENGSETVIEGDEKEAAKVDEKIIRPKPRPVAFVPPRMLSENKKNTISPESLLPPSAPVASENETSRRARGRSRRRSKADGEDTRSPSARSDTSQSSKTDLEERSPCTAVQNDSVSISDASAPTSEQVSQAGHRYMAYQAHELRSPITFPKLPIDGMIGDDMKSSKQFLKTSGKLLNAAPNKWCTFQDISNSPPYYSIHERHRAINTYESLSQTQANDGKKPIASGDFSSHNVVPSSTVVAVTTASIPYPFNQKFTHEDLPSTVSWTVCNEAKRVLTGVGSAHNFPSYPINPLLVLPPSHPKMSGPPPVNVSMSEKSGEGLTLDCGSGISTKLSVASIFGESRYPTINSTSNRATHEMLRSHFIGDQKSSVAPVKEMFGERPTSDSVTRSVMEQSKGVSGSVTSFQNWLPSSSDLFKRSLTSSWTSSTFSMTHLQPIDAVKKPKKSDASVSNDVSRLANDSTVLVDSPAASGNQLYSTVPNTQPSTNSAINYLKPIDTIQTSSLTNPAVNLIQTADAKVTYHLSQDLKTVQTAYNPLQLLTISHPDATHPGASNGMQPFTSQPLLTKDTQESVAPKAKKKRGRKPKSELKKNEETAKSSNKMSERYHYPFTILPAETINNTRLNESGMKRKVEETGSFHMQYTDPDVEDHFRTTFNSFCHKSNRESLNTILEKVKIVKSTSYSPVPVISGISASVISGISVINPTSIAQQSAIPSSAHYFAPPNRSATSALPVKTEGTRIVTSNPAGKESMLLFAIDKPIPFSSENRNFSEAHTNSRDHHIERSSVSTSIPLAHGMTSIFERSPAPVSQHFSFSSTSSATPLYCPSTMKLLKSTHDGAKINSGGGLLLQSKGEPINPLPTSYVKVQNFPSKTQEFATNPRKPNPEMFLNSFSGGTFIPPTIPGGHPTFIPSNPNGRQDGHLIADSLLKPPAPKKTRGRKSKQNEKQLIASKVSDHGSSIDFSKSPSNSLGPVGVSSSAINLINPGFRPPVIRNAIPAVTTTVSLSLDVRGMISSPTANTSNQAYPPISSKMILPMSMLKSNPSAVQTIWARTPLPGNTVCQGQIRHPVNTINHAATTRVINAVGQVTSSHPTSTVSPAESPLPVNTVSQAPSPVSPTYNHPRLVLLNMPTVMMMSSQGNSANDGNQVLQRQRSMTSPTFPPPHS